MATLKISLRKDKRVNTINAMHAKHSVAQKLINNAFRRDAKKI